ncbi:MAG: hypothetical protein EOM90_04680 [Alphaproteobacteria bacterium]|nr:hypothetical protein [Alphaproteobacteria bacterium]
MNNTDYMTESKYITVKGQMADHEFVFFNADDHVFESPCLLILFSRHVNNQNIESPCFLPEKIFIVNDFNDYRRQYEIDKWYLLSFLHLGVHNKSTPMKMTHTEIIEDIKKINKHIEFSAVPL